MAAGARGRAVIVDVAVIATAIAGLWLFGSYYSYLSNLSWWHESVSRLRRTTIQEKPDYDLVTLPWQVVKPRLFEVKDGTLTLVTGAEPSTYQVIATVAANGASTVDFHFDTTVESGAVTIGLLQRGQWIASSSSTGVGTFADSNAAQLGYARTLSVVIANNNPAGESRLVVHSLRVYLRR